MKINSDALARATGSCAAEGPSRHRIHDATARFAEYAVNHINTLARMPDTMMRMSEATLGRPPPARPCMAPTELGGLVAGESIVGNWSMACIGLLVGGVSRKALERKPGDA